MLTDETLSTVITAAATFFGLRLTPVLANKLGELLALWLDSKLAVAKSKQEKV